MYCGVKFIFAILIFKLARTLPLAAIVALRGSPRHGRQLQEAMNQRMLQLRAVQKRMLLRLRAKAQTSVDGLSTLLSHTTDSILQLCQASSEGKVALESMSCSLAASTEMMITLTKLRFQLDAESFGVLHQAWSLPTRASSCDHELEEQIEMALSHLNRTVLAEDASEYGDGGLLSPKAKNEKSQYCGHRALPSAAQLRRSVR